MPTLNLPPHFKFGAATSAFQIEGVGMPMVKVRRSGIRSATPGKVKGDEPGDMASDSYHRYGDDIALMRELGLDTYRISLSWSRRMPEGTGQPGRRRLLRPGDRRTPDADIDPNVTLYRGDLPQALEDRGGWAHRDVADRYGEYAAVVFDRFSDRVHRWATLNEPTAIWVGYGVGFFAPGRSNARAGRQAVHNALLAHGRGVQAFRAAGSPGEPGIVLDI